MAVKKHKKKTGVRRKKTVRKPLKRKVVKKARKKKAKAIKAVKKKVQKVRRKVKEVLKPEAPKAAVEENLVGIITHYFPHVNAAVLKLMMPLSVGDNIRIKGHTTDFTQTVNSIQINHFPYQTANKGDEIGLGVIQRVRRKDRVYKI